MKLNLSVRKIAEITGAELISSAPDTVVTSFVTDSRVVAPGDAFIALKGQKHDARKFIPDVLSKGAAVILAEKGFDVAQKAKASFLLVEDSLKALQALAKYHRLNSTLKVAAITGSNGKSTTKQMLRAICETAGETAANMGNFNNQFGVPFSLLEIQPKHKYGIFELGASHPGDILETASLAVPDVAVITNVGPSHLEFFHDLETIYKTKTEIAQCLNFGGTLVYNADDEYLSRLKTEFKGKSLSFGFHPGADLQILDTEKFSFTYKGEAYVLDLNLARHDKLNAAAAAAAAIALGLYMDNVKKGLLSFTPMPMRMEHLHKNGVEFILDCYNANPASMKNALEILGHASAEPRVAVLGDMKELGETSKEYHRLVAREVLDNHINYCFLAGPEMKYAYEKLQTAPGVKVFYAQAPQRWTGELKKVLAKGGTCLVKASRSMNFENILKEI
ncbi:UDP-N-acetylmuramoyl-tripeptide--D-alanyl-D-alanine ligase [Candidatus Avelusimicrobium fimicolum]|uniref:UDP-N-acetylmuramoyl-tripeptide--D-alanyl-D- alanine ligase n=1 Tax=Candidatus Avelusimicrobium fimicolum TaxID=3416216 RepID=UPI003D129C6A